MLESYQHEILQLKERICRQMAGSFPVDRLSIISVGREVFRTEEALVFEHSPGVYIGLAYFFWKNGKAADGFTIKVCPFGVQVAQEKMQAGYLPKKEK